MNSNIEDVIDSVGYNITKLPNTNVGDTISRQAAIDAIDKCSVWVVYTQGDSQKDEAEFAENIIKQTKMAIQSMLREDLPSAQTETAKRIVGKSKGGMTLWYQCDMCNEPVDVQDNFCRGCGRRLIDERPD